MIPEYTSCQEGCSGIPFFTVLMTVYRVTQRQATKSLYCHLKLPSTLLVRMEISKLSGIPSADLCFHSQYMHKPILLSAPQYHFNYSHTRNMILCGISATEPVGVDIERIDTNMTIGNMENVFHPIEFLYINNGSSAPIRSYRFYKIWTQKEAYIKYLGTGFSEKIQDFNTLDSSFSFHLHTWIVNDYLCSMFLPSLSNPTIQLVNESDVQHYFLNIFI